jgi:hypothetical protein
MFANMNADLVTFGHLWSNTATRDDDSGGRKRK